MKKWMLISFLIFFLCSACTKKCIYQEPRPTLSSNEYNSVWDVYWHFAYFVPYLKKEYPFYNESGTVVMLCGYLKDSHHPIGETRDYICVITDSLESNPNSIPVYVRFNEAALDSVDINEKCYIKGTLSFGYSDYVWIDSPPYGACWTPKTYFYALEIKN